MTLLMKIKLQNFQDWSEMHEHHPSEGDYLLCLTLGMACSQLAHVPPPLCIHQGETSFTHLHTGLLAATLCALHRITGLAAAVIAICIGLAAVEVCEGLVLIAPAAQLDWHSRWSIDHLDVHCPYFIATCVCPS